MNIIARIHTDFPTKFGIPRQSGLVNGIHGIIVFEPEYRNPAAFQGMEGFSHIWLIWQFSENIRNTWSATVRPPRLGGNKHMGVFATRSSFRPNPIGLSSVRLEKIELNTSEGPVLHVSGVDMMDGTPIYDIKPYLPYADCHPEATGGFAEATTDYALKVLIPEEWLNVIPEEKREALTGILSQDPRPSYQKNDTERIYGFEFAGLEIKFQVKGDVITVCKVED